MDVKDAAEYAGLIEVSDEKPGVRRRRSGKGFRYQSARGERITDEATLKRINERAQDLNVTIAAEMSATTVARTRQALRALIEAVPSP